MDKIKGNRYLTTPILAIVLILSTIVQSSIKPTNSSDSGPILANPCRFQVSLYEDFSRFEGIPLAFHLTITSGEAGFPAGLYITGGPLPGLKEIPPGSGNFVRASDRLFHMTGPFSATEIVQGFNSTEATIFAHGAYGSGMLVTEPLENRIQRVQFINNTPVVTTFSASAGTEPHGPAALAYDENNNLFMTDAAGERILRVHPNGTTELFAEIPLPELPPGALFRYLTALTYDASGRYGGGFITATFTGCYPHPVDAIYAVSIDGSTVTQLLDDAHRLRSIEFLTLGPGGAFGSDLFVTWLGTGHHGNGGVCTMAPNGTLTPFLTGIDPSHVIFDTEDILGGGMFVTDFNQQDTGYFDGPPRIWRVTEKPALVGGVAVPVDRFGLLAPYFGLASTIMVAAVATSICVKHVKRRKEKQ